MFSEVLVHSHLVILVWACSNVEYGGRKSIGIERILHSSQEAGDWGEETGFLMSPSRAHPNYLTSFHQVLLPNLPITFQLHH